MADLGDAGEVLGYIIGFWAFIFSPKYRARVLARWREAHRPERGFMVLDAIIAAAVGLGIPVVIVWLLA